MHWRDTTGDTRRLKSLLSNRYCIGLSINCQVIKSGRKKNVWQKAGPVQRLAQPAAGFS
jgi:hypothetical protein